MDQHSTAGSSHAYRSSLLPARRISTVVALGVATCLLLLTLALALLTAHLTGRGYSQLEQREAAAVMERVCAALDRQQSNQLKSTRDYATWTETYDHMLGAVDNYAEENLAEEALLNLRVAGALLFDNQGMLRSGRLTDAFQEKTGYDLDSITLEMRSSLPGLLAQPGGCGFVKLARGPITIVSIAPILRNDGSGPPAGNMVHFIPVDENYHADLSGALLVKLRIDPLSEKVFPGEDESSDMLVMADQLRDVHAMPVAMLRVWLPRDITRLGTSMMHIQWVAYGLLVLASGALIAFTLRVLVLRRLEAISADVRALASARDLSHRVRVEGYDELADMAVGINHMLGELEQADQQRREAQSAEARLTARLLRAQKTEALGTMAGGMAHDFNNMLTVILNSVQLMRMRGEQGQENQARHIERIEKAARNGADMVGRLSAFGRVDEVVRQPRRLSRIVDDVVELMRPGLSGNQRLLSETKCLDDRVNVDALRINQLVANLLLNATQATAGVPEGTIEVVIDQMVLPDKAWPETSVALAAGEYVGLTITDNGPGVPLELESRIFDPFFTTKGVGKGSGLGLAMVKSIAAAHEGAVELRSRPGQTVFAVHLPLCDQPEEAVQPPARTQPDLNKLRILVVEDEAIVRESMKLMLSGMGHKVTIAADGQLGLKAYLEQQHELDLVITDQRMPNMLGTEMAAAIQRQSPGFPILLMSGFTGPISSEQKEASGIRTILAKPFSIVQIKQAIAACF